MSWGPYNVRQIWTCTGKTCLGLQRSRERAGDPSSPVSTPAFSLQLLPGNGQHCLSAPAKQAVFAPRLVPKLYPGWVSTCVSYSSLFAEQQIKNVFPSKLEFSESRDNNLRFFFLRQTRVVENGLQWNVKHFRMLTPQ